MTVPSEKKPPKQLPIHEGDTPPENQVRGMAAPEDIDDARAAEQENN